MKSLQAQLIKTTINPNDKAIELLDIMGMALWELVAALWIIVILILFIYSIFFRTRNKR